MRTFEDIVPPSRRTGPPGSPPPPPPGGRPVPRPPRSRFPYLIVFVALVVIAGSAAMLMYFSGAKIEITPSTSAAPADGTFTAGASSELPFTLVSTKKTASASVVASGTKQVSTSALGNITIYNTQSKPQQLVATTRFATAAGLIFKIPKGVTIPAGSADKPGSVTVQVVASAPGPTYNIEPSSFTVPGLAGSPEASMVYARSAEAMTGGAVGPVPVVESGDAQAAVDSLSSSLTTDLEAALASQVPEGYVLLPGAATSSYRELAPAPAETGKANIQVEGTITAVVFPSVALASAIASSTSGSNGARVLMSSGTTLILTPSSGFPSSNAESFSFSLSGTALLVSKVDSMQIATAVAGKSRSEAQIILTNYPEVKRAALVLRPFWRQSFPEDPAAITVILGEPAT